MSDYIRLLLPLNESPDDDDLAEREDSLSETLGEAFGGSAWLSAEGFAVWIDPAGENRDTLIQAAARALRVEPALLAVSDAGSPEDWRSEWRQSFQPIQAGGFLILPPWLADQDGEGNKKIVIEPGAGFGTGQHETTRLALAGMGSLWAGRRDEFAKKAPRVLDVGSGSGVLAIAALLLGAREPVAATEIDADSEKNARENFELNGLAPGAVDYRLEASPAAFKAGAFDVVLCNMLLERFRPIMAPLAKALAPGGTLLLSGFLDSEEKEAAELLRAAGLEPRGEALAEGEWRLLAAGR